MSRHSPQNPGARSRRAGSRALATLLLGLLCTAAATPAAADPVQLGPFATSDVFETPGCSPACTPGDFPLDYGVLRTFVYTLTPGDVVTDILIEGVWGGTNPRSAPVEVYLGAARVATCTAADLCITDPTGRVAWNGGAGFRLTDLGVDLADFQGNDATLSVVQTGTATADTVDLSGLQVTVFVERTCEPEICDGFDNDCDLQVDEDITPTPTTCGVGECSSNVGVLECQSGTLVNTCDPLAGATADDQCDGLDNDCDGAPDDEYVPTPTACGVGECSSNTGEIACLAGVPTDTCDPLAGATADTQCDGLDNDCDGAPDDEYVPTPTTCGVGSCSGNAGQIECLAGVPTDSCNPLAGATADTQCDGLDNDCDGAPDDEYVPTPTTCGVGVCAGNAGEIACLAGVPTDTCDPFAGAATDDQCDGLDNDCDVAVDEDAVPIVTGTDVGLCQTEIQTCIGGSFQITQTGIGPVPETCDGIDENCNGAPDDGVADLVSGSDVGLCQIEIQSCIGGSFQITQTGIGPAPELCNGLDENCNGTPDDGVADLVSGSDVGQCQTEIQSCIGGSFQITQAGIGPAPETCNGLDDDCNAQPDDGIADIVTGTDSGVCQTEIQSCVGGSFQVTQTGIGPSQETCNGLDDDCNDVPDDGIDDIVTGTDVGACRTGIQSCIGGSFQVTQVGIPPAQETCNGIDEDCDGTPDNGITDLVSGSDIGECRTEIQRCLGGSFQVTQTGIGPVPEQCNGLDDDCDTVPDDNIPDIVTTTDTGECQAEIQSCIDGSFQITQTGVGPAPEQCNGLDDDCDEQIDEDIADLVNGSDVGACRAEIQSCVGGSFQVTQTAIGPTIEICNGIDDDCDTVPDDDIADIVTGSDVGECRTEIQSCVDGSFQVTQTGITPETETCNGLDDDCNAQPDDGIDPIATGSNLGECRSEIRECIGGSFQITQTGIDPVAEICNGLDENCNSIVDDIDDIVTGSDVGECRTEIQKCLGGSFQVTQTEIGPAPEVCNGLDDDCDGSSDDGVADIATGSNVGECQEEVQSCIGGSFQVVQARIDPTSEICNGLDDDCTGAVDNGFGPISCGTGVCEATVESCVNGVPQSCVPLTGPGEELCLDGLDDDCDGTVDDGDVCELEGFDSFAGDVELATVGGLELALVAAEAGGLRLLEFSELGPAQVGVLDPDTCKDGFVNVAASVQDVAAETESGFSYLAAGPCGFWVADGDSNPASPVWVAAIDTPGFALDVEIVEEESLLFVADHNGGLETYDVSNPAAPSPMGQVGRANAGFGAAIDVDVFEGLAYVATTRGLRIVDPANPFSPVLIGVYDTPGATGPGQDVEVVAWEDETHAYLSAFQEGVYILDVTDPTLPELIGTMPSRVPGVTAVYETTVAGQRAFLAEDNPELRIYDISDPADPIELEPFPARGHVWDIAVDGPVAFLAFGEDPFGETPGAEAVHVTLMGLQPEDVGAVPEPTRAALVIASLTTLAWLRARTRRRGGAQR